MTCVSLLVSVSCLNGQGWDILGIRQGLEAQVWVGEWGGWKAAVNADQRCGLLGRQRVFSLSSTSVTGGHCLACVVLGLLGGPHITCEVHGCVSTTYEGSERSCDLQVQEGGQLTLSLLPLAQESFKPSEIQCFGR